MKSQTMLLPLEGKAELHAQKAIQQIYQSVKERYPVLTSAEMDQFVRECLIEIMAEDNFLKAQ
jgi:hypothetical protein